MLGLILRALGARLLPFHLHRSPAGGSQIYPCHVAEAGYTLGPQHVAWSALQTVLQILSLKIRLLRMLCYVSSEITAAIFKLLLCTRHLCVCMCVLVCMCTCVCVCACVYAQICSCIHVCTGKCAFGKRMVCKDGEPQTQEEPVFFGCYWKGSQGRVGDVGRNGFQIHIYFQFSV